MEVGDEEAKKKADMRGYAKSMRGEQLERVEHHWIYSIVHFTLYALYAVVPIAVTMALFSKAGTYFHSMFYRA